MARRRRVFRKNEALAELLQRSADYRNDKTSAIAAMDEFAAMVQDEFNKNFGFAVASDTEEALDVNPAYEIQEAIFDGDIFSDIFQITMLGYDEQPMFPMGIVTPGTEGEYVAYTMPNNGRIPNRYVEGDEVTINTYRIANAIDWSIKYARQARVDVISQALKVLRDGFIMKMNDDAWHTLLAAGLDRGLMVYDSSASAGSFTKKLLQLMKIAMKRNGGGNMASSDAFTLTDLYISPEAMADITNWGGSDLSEISRTEMERDAKGTIQRLYQVNIHGLTELGEGQKYNNYYLNTLGGSLAASDVELVVGLDKSKEGKFIMPVRGDGINIMADESMIRSNYQGYFGDAELGFGVLDTRAVILGSL